MGALQQKVGVIGATGVVGRELLALMESFSIRPAELRLMASARSAGSQIKVFDEDFVIEETTPERVHDLDLLFFSASSELSRQTVKDYARQGVVVIDLSSAFRQDPDVPLIIPEINPDQIQNHKGVIANPNCTAAVTLMPLKIMHDAWGLRQVITSSYQAASGAGLAAMNELKQQTADMLNGKEVEPEVFPYPIAFNLFSHDSAIEENGYCGEENKMVAEMKKILDLPDLKVSPTCVRVPMLRAHSVSVNAQFDEKPSVEMAYRLLDEAEGITVIDNRAQNRFPMPMDASGQNDVFVGRFREDNLGGNGLNFFVCGDQIRKGAALNALQTAMLL